MAGSAEEVLADLRVGQDMARIAGVDYLAARHDVAAIRAGEREACVLLDNQDGDALFAQRVYPVDYLLLVER